MSKSLRDKKNLAKMRKQDRKELTLLAGDPTRWRVESQGFDKAIENYGCVIYFMHIGWVHEQLKPVRIPRSLKKYKDYKKDLVFPRDKCNNGCCI